MPDSADPPKRTQTVTDFSPFSAYEFARYTIDRDAGSVFDTKFKRYLVAIQKRGHQPFFRLVDDEGVARHVEAREIFSEEVVEELMRTESDFEPSDFLRYEFDLNEGTAKSRASGKPMTLIDQNGWRHYYLTRDDGKRVRVTPAEIKRLADRERWEVKPPKDAIVHRLFPTVAFTPEGKVVRISSSRYMVEPRPVVPADRTEGGELVYELRSTTGKTHRFLSHAIKALFTRTRSDA